MSNDFILPDGGTDVDGWLSAYESDDNVFWRTETGHIQNVLDHMIERFRLAFDAGYQVGYRVGYLTDREVGADQMPVPPLMSDFVLPANIDWQSTALLPLNVSVQQDGAISVAVEAPNVVNE